MRDPRRPGPGAPASRRPLARALAVAGILLLGVVAAGRLELGFLPRHALPELAVGLRLPQPLGLEPTAREWAVPLETALRAAGGVASVATEVQPGRLSVRARLVPGTDPERKAARLESELAVLRRSLPAGGSLAVWPVAAGGGGRALALFLPGDSETGGADPGVIAAIRDLPGVRTLVVAGDRRRELRLDLAPGVDAAGLARLGGDGVLLGTTETGRELWLGLPGRRLADEVVAVGGRAVPATALATTRVGLAPAGWRARVDGRSGVVLVVEREPSTSPLALERQVAETLDRLGVDGARVLDGEGEPLRRLLARVATAIGAAALLSALVVAAAAGLRAGLWQLAALPLAVAAAANALWLLRLPLDVVAVVGAVAGVGAALPFQVVRLGSPPGGRAAVAVVAAWLLPTAVALLGGDLAVFAAEPALAFAAAASAAVVAALLLPTPAAPAPGSAQALLRFLFRRPWAVLLAAAALGHGLFSLFGDELRPRSGSLATGRSDLAVFLGFPEGTSDEEAGRRVAAVERHLLSRAETAGVWGLHDRRAGELFVDLEPAHRRPRDRRRLAARLATQLAGLGAAVRVVPLGGASGGEPLRLASSLRTRPELDFESRSYRFVLRSTDLPRLRAAHERIREDLARSPWRIAGERFESGWGRPSVRLELVPLPAARPAEVDAAVALLAERASPAGSRERTVPGAPERPVTLRIAAAEALADEDEPIPLRRLLRPRLAAEDGSRTSPARLFEVRETLAAPEVRREDGAFALPVTVRFLGFTRGDLLVNVLPGIDRLLARSPTAGVDVERPDLEPERWTEERRRLLAVAAFLPALLLALGAARLDSLPLGLVAAAPGALAIALVALAARLGAGNVDEVGLLALSAALAATLPLAFEVAAAMRVAAPGPLAGAAGYDWLARRLPHAAAAAAGWLVLTAGAGLGLDAEKDPWAPPLRLAGVAGAATIAASFLVLPVALRAVDRLRFHDRAVSARRARPPAWREEGPPVLEARRLTVVYPGGFRALAGASFRLEPGIVGLLGPNGAGKTTLLRCLCGLVPPSRGRVLYRGVALEPANLAAYRRGVGYLPQGFGVYEGLTAEEYLDFWALERGIADPARRAREIEDLLALVGLEGAASRKVRDFSGGMRRRVGIARSLLGSPPVLLVDEPTTGLDVESRDRLRESLLAVATQRIVLFSTHIASDVAAAAARILLLVHGRLVFDGPAGALQAEAEGRVFETVLDDEELRPFAARYRVTARVRGPAGVRVRAVAAPGQDPAGTVVRPTLEEAYLAKLGAAAPGSVGRRTRSLLDLGASAER